MLTGVLSVGIGLNKLKRHCACLRQGRTRNGELVVDRAHKAICVKEGAWYNKTLAVPGLPDTVHLVLADAAGRLCNHKYIHQQCQHTLSPTHCVCAYTKPVPSAQAHGCCRPCCRVKLVCLCSAGQAEPAAAEVCARFIPVQGHECP